MPNRRKPISELRYTKIEINLIQNLKIVEEDKGESEISLLEQVYKKNKENHTIPIFRRKTTLSFQDDFIESPMLCINIQVMRKTLN